MELSLNDVLAVGGVVFGAAWGAVKLALALVLHRIEEAKASAKDAHVRLDHHIEVWHK